MVWGIVRMWDERFTVEWDYLVTEAGVPMSWVYPDHGGQNGNVDEPWKTHIARVADLGGPFVVITPIDGHNVQGEVALPGFTHPNECYYLFGSDRHNMSLDDDGIEIDPVLNGYQGEMHKVYIPGVGKSLHSPLAAAMVMYDRIVKGA